MNDAETKLAGTPEAEDVKQQCACLQRQVVTLLVALTIVSGTLTVALWRQARNAWHDLDAIKLPAAQLIHDYNQNRASMDAFLGKLAEYGRTHPDFAPIQNKYRHLFPATTAPPKAVTAPAPQK